MRSVKGLSLVEVIISLALMAMAFKASLVFMAYLGTRTAEAQNRQAAISELSLLLNDLTRRYKLRIVEPKFPTDPTPVVFFRYGLVVHTPPGFPDLASPPVTNCQVDETTAPCQGFQVWQEDITGGYQVSQYLTTCLTNPPPPGGFSYAKTPVTVASLACAAAELPHIERTQWKNVATATVVIAGTGSFKKDIYPPPASGIGMALCMRRVWNTCSAGSNEQGFILEAAAIFNKQPKKWDVVRLRRSISLDDRSESLVFAPIK